MDDIPHPLATDALSGITLGAKEYEEDTEDMPENTMVGAAVVIYQCIDKDTGEETAYIGYSTGASWLACQGLILEAYKNIT